MQLLVLLLALCSPAFAARVQLQVESDQLVVGQSVALELQVIDGRAEGVPDLAVGDGLALRYRGQGQSMSIVGMKSTRVVRYTYQLTALREGSFKVGPAEVDLGGSIVRHPAITIEVARSADGGRPPAEVETELSDRRPFVGEVVTYRVEFRRREEARNIRWTPPETPGFVAEPSAELEQADRSVIENGVEEAVLDIMLPLRATAAGAHTLAPAVIIADMPAPPDPRTGRRPQDVFGRYRTRTTSLSGQPLDVEVRPLPEDGRPANFSGLVGTYTIRAESSAARVAVGDTVTLKVSLEGNGVLAGFKLPAITDSADFRVYDDAPVVESAAGPGGLRSRAVFNRALVPLRVGELKLPPVVLAVFDPATEAFIEDVALPSGRSDHVAVPLSNGDILLESGLAGNGFGTRRTLWFHAADHTVEELELGDEVGTLYRSAAPLTQGALICGGVDAGVLLAEDWVPVDTCVRLDDDGTVLPAPPLPRPLAGHAMVALPNGDVLVTGGTDQALTPGGAPAQALDVAYRYDAGSNDWETLPDLQHARFGHTAFVLPGGHVAIVGGVEAMGTLFNPESGDPVDCAERFSVDTEQFSAQPGCNGHSAGAFGTVASHPSAGALVFTGFYRGAEGDFLGTRNVGFARPIGPPNP